MKNFYDMLSLRADAPADEIKKAFRREIARYHPDKVQHLGQEFQEMASGIAADLTEAYRILMDPALRARYDEDLVGHGVTDAPPAPPPRPAAPDEPPPAPGPSSAGASSAAAGAPAPPRPSPLAGVEFVKKASLSRLRACVDDVMGNSQPASVPGFDVALTTKPKRALFKKADDKIRLLVKFVPLVDAEAVVDVWSKAMKGKAADAILCVLLLGPGMAPSKDLAGAISEQRRKSRDAAPVLVPVDVRDWEALFPPDTPALVRTLIQCLKEEKR